MENSIKQLQQNLARDLVQLEENKLVSESQLEKITDAYTKVYNLISSAVDKPLD